MAPSFDIIIPTHNNLPELKKCLDGFAHIAGPSFRIFVCVDGSTDGTQTVISGTVYPFPVVMLEHPDRRRHGRNATRNLALPHLAAENLLLLDSDASPLPGLLERHLERLADPNSVSLGIIEYENQNSNIWARYTQTRGRYRIPDAAKVDYRLFNSGNVALKTDRFCRLGGQDSAMTTYGGGDTEFAIRLHEQFHPDFYNTRSAAAVSTMNKDLDTALSQMVEFGRYNLRYLYQKHPNHRHLYAMRLMGENTLQARLYRSLFPVAMVRLMRRLVERLPRPLDLYVVRYLVLASVYTGFVKDGTIR
jgi:glycosyltransferase involved in cell wall biosynthesis